LCLLHDPCPFCVGFTLPSLLPSLLRVKTKVVILKGQACEAKYNVKSQLE
jgi:hypothetical protein